MGILSDIAASQRKAEEDAKVAAAAKSSKPSTNASGQPGPPGVTSPAAKPPAVSQAGGAAGSAPPDSVAIANTAPAPVSPPVASAASSATGLQSVPDQGSVSTFNLRKLRSLALVQSLSLLPTETRKEYEDLLDELRSTINPTDIIEEMWVSDVARNQWDIRRYSRSKDALVKVNRVRALEKILNRLIGKDDRIVRFHTIDGASDAADLAQRCVNGDDEAKQEVENLLTAAGLDWEAVFALAMALEIDAIERIDKMLKQTEARRDAVLRQLDYRRTSLGRLPLGKIQKVEDVEFREVESVTEPAKKAA
jgi:hypothetical protein